MGMDGEERRRDHASTNMECPLPTVVVPFPLPLQCPSPFQFRRVVVTSLGPFPGRFFSSPDITLQPREFIPSPFHPSTQFLPLNWTAGRSAAAASSSFPLLLLLSPFPPFPYPFPSPPLSSRNQLPKLESIGWLVAPVEALTATANRRRFRHPKICLLLRLVSRHLQAPAQHFASAFALRHSFPLGVAHNFPRQILTPQIIIIGRSIDWMMRKFRVEEERGIWEIIEDI